MKKFFEKFWTKENKWLFGETAIQLVQWVQASAKFEKLSRQDMYSEMIYR